MTTMTTTMTDNHDDNHDYNDRTGRYRMVMPLFFAHTPVGQTGQYQRPTYPAAHLWTCVNDPSLHDTCAALATVAHAVHESLLLPAE